MIAPTTSPPVSPSPSPASRGSRTPLSLDLSSIPPLITPSPPTNTLLITNLQDPSLFLPPSLHTIRNHLASLAPLHSFSPLRSLRRIILTLYTVEDAITIRTALLAASSSPPSSSPSPDAKPIAHRIRIYFGEPTPIDLSSQDRHLHAPAQEKMFFISPPPSPPHGWEEGRLEGEPNKLVHAADLASALASLNRGAKAQFQPISPVSPDDDDDKAGRAAGDWTQGRERTGSTTVVYHPGDHGSSYDLPKVMVEDTTGEGGEEGRILAHTARPPVELMEA